MSVTYPRREISSEPFGDQMDFIEKRLIELQNMPLMYMKNRKKPKQQLQQNYQQGYGQRFQSNAAQNFQQHQQHHNPQLQVQAQQQLHIALYGKQQNFLQQQQQQQQTHQQHLQVQDPNLSQNYYFLLPATNISAIGVEGSHKQMSAKPVFDPFATEFQPNYAQNIWGSGTGNREKGIATVWG